VKILRPFTGTGAVFWPIGKPPVGTCEFATRQCEKYCYAALPEWPDFDEEIRINEEEKHDIYQLFIHSPINWLFDEVLAELDGLQTNILHWFGSGDCPSKDVDRVIEIIDRMRPTRVTQMGFTRNVKLWEQAKDIFAFTVESQNSIDGRDGLFAVADYKNGTSIMYSGDKPTRGGYCGPELCQDRIEEKLTHFINCQTCRRMKLGCFDGKKSGWK